MAHLPRPQLPKRGTKRRVFVRYTLTIFTLCFSMATVANADILMPGHKPVSHILVFQESDLFQQHRLVAAPIKGLAGWVEVQPGQPFNFSNKYGTRIYWVPQEVKIEEFDPAVFEQWPHVPPPVHEVASLPLSSPVSQVVTQLAFTGVLDGLPVVEVVSEQRLDRLGKPVAYGGMLLLLGGVFFAGIVVTWIAVHRIRRLRSSIGNSSDSQVSG